MAANDFTFFMVVLLGFTAFSAGWNLAKLLMLPDDDST
jgi:hypothetical protein